MKPRLWMRLLVSHAAVALVGGATLFIATTLAAPTAFESAMGQPGGGGMAGMGDMMSTLVRSAFQEALATALIVALAAATLAALVVSVALSLRISRPVGRLVEASTRIASGRYAERVAVSSNDELGELAATFNTMAASLAETEQRRVDLVGDVAHELRTPLSTLDGYLEGLQDGMVEPDAETWRLLRGETARLSRLVNDLQDLWRAEARQLPLSPTEVDVSEMLRSAADRFAPQAREHDVEIAVEQASQSAVVRADAARLDQIVDNFLANAIRYSPAGGRVSLRASGRDDGVAIAVVDQGPGLTAEQLERVFERFYRVDPARSREAGGSGIGLAIARALAEAMGGRVEAASPGPGRGATFTVVLPRA